MQCNAMTPHYAGKHIIGPFADFTAIIGPNGAGKSNMMDAISFVLGVQSRHLRSTQLKELIFRKDANSVPSRRASVALVYRVSEGELEGYAEGREIHFGRSVASSGVSTYRLDGKEVTYEAYEGILRKIGVLVKARNFLVFQGDVESVASKSPAELTTLLSHISHADECEAEYEELLRQRNEAEENTIFSLQKKKMYATQRKEIKEQKDEAELFLEKQQTLDETKTEYVLWQIFLKKTGMFSRRSGADELHMEMDVAKSEEVAAEDALTESKKELAKASRAVQTAEKESAARESRLGKVLPKMAGLQEAVKTTKKKITDLSAGEKRLGKDLATQESSLADLRAELKRLEAIEGRLKADLAGVAARGGGAASSSSSSTAPAGSIQLDAAMMTEYTRIRGEVAARTSKEKTLESNLEREVISLEHRIQDMRSQETSLTKEVEILRTFIADNEERSGKLRASLAECKTELARITSDRAALTKQTADSDHLINKLSDEIDVIADKLKEVGEDRIRGKREQSMNDAIETMSRIFTGVHGKLVNLCKPIQKKYSNAIATAAGKNMDAIVVETKQVATECIRYLKDQRIGTCSFLPLDNITNKPVPDRLRSLGQKYRVAIDLVECEDRFRSAVSYALGSTIVCDTLEDAQHLGFTLGERVKIVTLNGHVISRAGAMTGGAIGRDTARDKWEDREVDELKRQRSLLESQLLEAKRDAPNRQSLFELETRYKNTQTKMQFSEADLTICEEKLAQQQQQLQLKLAPISSIHTELLALEKTLSKSTEKLKQLKATIRSVEVEEFRSFSSQVGVDNIVEYEEKVIKAHQELMARCQSTSEQKAAVSAQLEYEVKRDFKAAHEKQLASIERAKTELGALESELRDLHKQETALRNEVEQGLAKLNSTKADRAKAMEHSKELQKALTAATGKKDGIAKRISAEDIEAERMRAQLHEILQRARVDEIALPTVAVPRHSTTGGDASVASSSRGSGRVSSSRISGSLGGASVDEVQLDLDLEWGGTSSQRRSMPEDSSSLDQSSSSSRGKASAHSAHFSQADNRLGNLFIIILYY
jgi:structural maintenance of chromosome 1